MNDPCTGALDLRTADGVDRRRRDQGAECANDATAVEVA
jgi:hypothetical protein